MATLGQHADKLILTAGISVNTRKTLKIAEEGRYPVCELEAWEAKQQDPSWGTVKGSKPQVTLKGVADQGEIPSLKLKPQ